MTARPCATSWLPGECVSAASGCRDALPKAPERSCPCTHQRSANIGARCGRTVWRRERWSKEAVAAPNTANLRPEHHAKRAKACPGSFSMARGGKMSAEAAARAAASSAPARPAPVFYHTRWKKRLTMLRAASGFMKRRPSPLEMAGTCMGPFCVMTFMDLISMRATGQSLASTGMMEMR